VIKCGLIGDLPVFPEMKRAARKPPLAPGLGQEQRRLAVLHAFLPLCGVGVVCASWIGSGSGSIVPPPEA